MFMIVVFQLTRMRYSLGLVCPPSCNFFSPLIPGREAASATPHPGFRAQPHDVQPPLTTWCRNKIQLQLLWPVTMGGKGNRVRPVTQLSRRNAPALGSSLVSPSATVVRTKALFSS